MKIARGRLVLVELDPTIGREQRGTRPSITVSDPEISADQRFPLIAVVPITGTQGLGGLYPALTPGDSGVLKTSYALVDQLRSIDKRRIRRVYGAISLSELKALDRGLELFLGLGMQNPQSQPLS